MAGYTQKEIRDSLFEIVIGKGMVLEDWMSMTKTARASYINTKIKTLGNIKKVTQDLYGVLSRMEKING